MGMFTHDEVKLPAAEPVGKLPAQSCLNLKTDCGVQSAKAAEYFGQAHSGNIPSKAEPDRPGQRWLPQMELRILDRPSDVTRVRQERLSLWCQTDALRTPGK